MESVMPNVGGALGSIIPEFTGPAGPLTNPQASPTSPTMPEGVGLGVPNF